MKRVILSVCAVTALVLIAAPRSHARQDSKANYKLQVHVIYNGSGSVDEKRKVYVVVWDTPNFVSGESAMPIAIKPSPTKDGNVTFDDLHKTPVYVSTVFDPTGKWDAQSPPPDGCSLGLYSRATESAAPVQLEPGKTNKIELTFDDTVKMREGKATR